MVSQEFDHVPEKVFTVGDLKQALHGIADDTPLIFQTAEEPGGTLAGPDQIAFDAGLHDNRFEVSLEFPVGRYYRTVWTADD